MKRRLRVYKKTVSIVNETATAMYENLVGDKKGFLLESYDKNYDRYKDLKLVDFYYDPSIRGTFTSADIGNDVAIFTYRKDGKMFSK